MEALFVDDRQLITLLHVSGVTHSIVFGHRCRARVQIFKELNQLIFGLTIVNLLRCHWSTDNSSGVPESWCPSPPTRVSWHTAGVTPVSCAQSPSLIAQAYQSSPRCLPKFPPVSPLTYPLIDIIFHPPLPSGHWVWVTLNSGPYLPTGSHPSSALSNLTAPHSSVLSKYHLGYLFLLVVCNTIPTWSWGTHCQ